MGYLVCTKQLGTLVNNDTKIVMIGLDGAGKTTILFKMKIGEIVTTIPTIGFNVKKLLYIKKSILLFGILEDKIRYAHCGNTIIKMFMALFSLLIQMIRIELLK